MKKGLTRLLKPGARLVSVAIFLLIPISALAQWSPSNYGSTGLPQQNIYYIIRGVVWWTLSIFGFFAVIGFVISGIMYLTAAGDEERQKKAKKQMYWSITGVIVGLMGLVILYAVDRMLNVYSYF